MREQSARYQDHAVCCERRQIARRRTEPGWRAAVLDEQASGHASRPRANEEGSGSRSASLSERSEQMHTERAEAFFLCE
jgi:hypothetical protein